MAGTAVVDVPVKPGAETAPCGVDRSACKGMVDAPLSASGTRDRLRVGGAEGNRRSRRHRMALAADGPVRALASRFAVAVMRHAAPLSRMTRSGLPHARLAATIDARKPAASPRARPDFLPTNGAALSTVSRVPASPKCVSGHPAGLGSRRPPIICCRLSRRAGGLKRGARAASRHPPDAGEIAQTALGRSGTTS
jgi:hypothetical protein